MGINIEGGGGVGRLGGWNTEEFFLPSLSAEQIILLHGLFTVFPSANKKLTFTSQENLKAASSTWEYRGLPLALRRTTVQRPCISLPMMCFAAGGSTCLRGDSLFRHENAEPVARRGSGPSPTYPLPSAVPPWLPPHPFHILHQHRPFPGGSQSPSWGQAEPLTAAKGRGSLRANGSLRPGQTQTLTLNRYLV